MLIKNIQRQPRQASFVKVFKYKTHIDFPMSSLDLLMQDERLEIFYQIASFWKTKFCFDVEAPTLLITFLEFLRFSLQIFETFGLLKNIDSFEKILSKPFHFEKLSDVDKESSVFSHKSRQSRQPPKTLPEDPKA